MEFARVFLCYEQFEVKRDFTTSPSKFSPRIPPLLNNNMTSLAAASSSVPPTPDSAKLLQRLSRVLRNDDVQVVFLNGAGMSVASGIPDFRSAGGLYETLRPELLTATPAQRQALADNPTGVVSWGLFRENTFPYLEVRRPFILGIAEQRWKPTVAHFFARVCHDKGKLKSILTQNIDGLDYHTGIPSEKEVSVHGSMGQVRCEGCSTFIDPEEFKNSVRSKIKDIYCMDDDAPKQSTEIICPACNRPLVKPNTVLYGRSLPPEFYAAVEDAFPRGGGYVDVLFVVGTSLTVQPAASVPRLATMSMRVVVNMEIVGESVFDFSKGSRDMLLRGECDSIFVDLAIACGWLDDLASHADLMCESSRALVLRRVAEEQKST